MKKLFLSLGLLSTALTSSAEIDQELYKQMPADNGLVFGMNYAAFLAVPEFKQMIEMAMAQQPAQSHIKPEDCNFALGSVSISEIMESKYKNFDSVIGFTDMKVPVDAAKLQEEAKAQGLEYKLVKLASGEELYSLNIQQAIDKAAENGQQAMPPGFKLPFDNVYTHINGNRTATGLSQDFLSKIANSKSGKSLSSAAGFIENLYKQKSSMFFVGLNIDDAFKSSLNTIVPEQVRPQLAMLNNMKSFVFAMNYEKEMLSFEIDLACVGSQEAQGYLGMFDMMIKPKLNSPNSPVKADDLKTSVQGNNFNISLKMPKETISQVIMMAMMNGMMNQPENQPAEVEEAPQQ